jgi:hypothetical protein
MSARAVDAQAAKSITAIAIATNDCLEFIIPSSC